MNRSYCCGDVVMELGEGSAVHETVQVFGRGKVRLGRNVRVDAFAIVTVGPEGVAVGDDVHVGANAMIFGSGAAVVVGNRCSLSPRSTIYTACDDFRRAGLIGPQNPAGRRNVIVGRVVMEDESALGHGAVMMPGSVLGAGSAVAAGMIVKFREVIEPGLFVNHAERTPRR